MSATNNGHWTTAAELEWLNGIPERYQDVAYPGEQHEKRLSIYRGYMASAKKRKVWGAIERGIVRARCSFLLDQELKLL